MTATRCETQVITVGVDTHQLVHHAAIVDSRLGSVADREFPATSGGFADLVDWMSRYGQVSRVGVESTGSYGAGLTRHLIGAGVEVCEIQCPATSTRRREGKSDVVDAYSAARQAATGNPDRLGMPKLSTGVVESIRLLKVPRDSAVKQRTAAYSQLRDLITTAPTPIREDLLTKTGKQRVARAIGYRPDPARLDDPTQAAKKSLRALATRIRALDIEIRDADKDLTKLTQRVAPTVLAMPQVGVQSTAQLLITAGQNIDRMRTEATFAKLCGVAPLPATSGKTTTRHRLNRGGDRQANSALYMIIIGRLANDPATRAYRTRRTTEGKTTNEIIRCLKRHLARSIYRALKHDLKHLDDL